MKKLLIPIILASLSAVTGCIVYKVDVQQGNVIEQDDLNQIKPRMTKRQVRYVLGTPLVVDPFHQDRWDYVYTYQPGGEAMQKKRVSLFFEDGKLARIEGDMQPQPGASGPRDKSQTVEIEKAHRKDKGIFSRIFDGE